MYYLWKDKSRSINNKLITYITDYHETNKDGKVKIDNYGYLELELLKKSKIKMELIMFAQNLKFEK